MYSSNPTCCYYDCRDWVWAVATIVPPRWLRERLVGARAIARPQARPVGWLVIIDRCGRRQRLPRSLRNHSV
jgi:hypothetical protein